MRIFLILFLISFIQISVSAQVKEFDQLELLYFQGHYRTVYKKANKLLDKPDYDYSKIPKFYKSLAIFQLADNDHYFKRNTDAYDEARALFNEVKSSESGMAIFNAHIYEVSMLKQDLYSRAEDLKRREENDAFNALNKVLIDLFLNVPSIDIQGEVPNREIAEFKEPSKESNSERDEVVNFALKYIGVPYVWAGNSPNGFDCSGFTSYVLAKFDKKVGRRAVDQYEGSQKLKQIRVQKGDLVFFDNGSGISHVGMIISEMGKPLVMVHASSSKGIMVTEIEKSDYWLKRLKSFGTYLQ